MDFSTGILLQYIKNNTFFGNLIFSPYFTRLNFSISHKSVGKHLTDM